jgi:hypothetical protein
LGLVLRERLATLVSTGGDKALADQAYQQIKAGDLVDAEETIGRLELYAKAWMRR